MELQPLTLDYSSHLLRCQLPALPASSKGKRSSGGSIRWHAPTPDTRSLSGSNVRVRGGKKHGEQEQRQGLGNPPRRRRALVAGEQGLAHPDRPNTCWRTPRAREGRPPPASSHRRSRVAPAYHSRGDGDGVSGILGWGFGSGVVLSLLLQRASKQQASGGARCHPHTSPLCPGAATLSATVREGLGNITPSSSSR